MADDLAKKKNNWEYLPLGTLGRPWPVMLQKEENGVVKFTLGTVESDTKPIMFQSNRPYEEVIPDLFLKMPTPGMLDAFTKIVDNTLVIVRGDAGYGKTTLAVDICAAMHTEGAVIYDAGGKNLQSLLVETVFDSRRSKDLIDQIDKALANNELNVWSLKRLGSLKIKEGEEEVSLLVENGGTRKFAWEKLRESGIDDSVIRDVFNDLKSSQQWNGSLNVGFEDRPGKLIQAAMQNRPLVIDEFLRHKIGTAGPLQVIWQVISGEFKSTEISLGNLGTFTLNHGDIPKVILTGNKSKDGKDIVMLSTSLDSRFVDVDVPMFTQEDWRGRLEQFMTGVEISLNTFLVPHKGVNEDGVDSRMPNDAKGFGESLIDLKKANGRVVPALQADLLREWKAVSFVCAKLAQGFSASEKLLDADSTLFKTGQLDNVRADVEIPGDAPKKVTPRLPRELINGALKMGFDAKPKSGSGNLNFKTFAKPVLKPSEEPASKNFGTRLKSLIEKWLCDVCGVTVEHTKRPNLFAQMTKVWTEAGILGPDSVLDQLNIKPVEKVKIVAGDDARLAADLINSVLRLKYATATPVTPEEAEMFLATLGKSQAQSNLIDRKFIDYTAVDLDPLTIANKGLSVETGQVTIPDYVANELIEDFHKRVSTQGIMSEAKVLANLAMPVIGPRMLRSLCNAGIKSNEEYVKILSASADVSVAFTTMICSSGDKVVRLHYLYNHQTKQALVVRATPGEVDPQIKHQAALSGMHYVSVNDANAVDVISAWLKDNLKEPVRELVKAFSSRNTVEFPLPVELQTPIMDPTGTKLDPKFKREKSKAISKAMENLVIEDLLLNKVYSHASIPSVVQNANISRTA